MAAQRDSGAEDRQDYRMQSPTAHHPPAARQAWEITKKDLLLLSRDYRAMIILVMFPLIFITIIGVTTGQLMVWGDEQQKLKVSLIDEVDYEAIEGARRSERAKNRRNARRLVVETVEAVQDRDGLLTSFGEADEREAVVAAVDKGDLHAAVFFGPEFFKRVEELSINDILTLQEGRLAGGMESLDMRLYSRSPSSRDSIIKGQVEADVVRTIVPYVACKNNILRLRIPQRCDEYDARVDPDAPLLMPRPPRERPATETQADAGPNEVYQVMIPGFTVMFVFFLVNVMARSFIHERDLGTLRRLRMAPVTSTALLAGKIAPFYLISLVQTAVLFVSGRLLFNMWWGEEPLLLLPIIAATSLAATGLGLLVATLVRTDSQVSAYSNLVVISLAGISGCFMPRDWLPAALQQISLATPHSWALIAYDQILHSPNPDVTTVWQSSGILLGFAALFFVAGCVRFRRSC
jgi:ABC-2 type transport system permease protein